MYDDKALGRRMSKHFLESLRSETKNAFLLCGKLNANPSFGSAVKDWIGSGTASVQYQAEHIFLSDLKKLFKQVIAFQHAAKAPSDRAKFALLYTYELLQRNDLIAQYDSQKINSLIDQPRFNENIALIENVSFFPETGLGKEGLVIPAVLSHIKSEFLQEYMSIMERLSCLMVQSGDKLTASEEAFLSDHKKMIQLITELPSSAQAINVMEDDTLEKTMEELNELIGLENIKTIVADLINFLKVKKLRQESGLKTTTNSLHAVFTGPPGTGKTTVARLLGRIFKHLGYLEKGQLIETDRSGMVAGYVGQTAIKADEIINKALDGVLFIDEAYSLNPGGFNDFGGEAIEILLKRMEDNRKRLVVVVAGYPDEMSEFIQSNPGLQSRFNRYFHFDHYSPDAMMKILKLHASKADFEFTPDAEEKVMEIFDRLYEKRHKAFGNARVVRNLFERITEIQANRIANHPEIKNDILIKIEEEDVPEILKTVEEIIQVKEDGE